MDALLISFLLCFLTESGGRLPTRFQALGQPHGVDAPLVFAMLLATGFNAAVSAVAGGLMAGMLTPEARKLFFALSLCAAGAALLFARRAPDIVSERRLGGFGAAALGLFLLGFGESPQFLIAGISAAYADPWMAGTGGWLGAIAACLLPALAGDAGKMFSYGGILRSTAAALMMLAGFFVAMSALRLL